MAVAESQLQVNESFWVQAEAQLLERQDMEAAQIFIDASSLAVRALEHRVFGRDEWLSVDQLPSVRALRERTDADSSRILAERRDQLNLGNFDAVPYAFDVLATGKKLAEAERMHGAASEEYARIYAGLYLDSKRHIAEARRRLTFEYFEPVEQKFDAAADSYAFGGYIFKEMVDNGLSPVGSEAVGVDTLIANRREEYTSPRIGKLAALAMEHAGVESNQQVTMFTVSQIDTSPQTMIWAMRFDPQRGSRFQEQIAFTKEFITHEVIVEACKQKGLLAQDAEPTQAELLGMQALSFGEEGVLGFMSLLDQIATEKSGRNIFMGEAVLENFVKDYTAVPGQAAERQSRQDDEAHALLKEVVRLAKDDVDGWLANHMIDTFVTNMLLDKVTDDPETAEAIFGKGTADTIRESIRLRQEGDIDGANRLLSAARAEAPMALVCTAGSCGLEAVNENSEDGKKIAKELRAEPGDTIVHDNERPCKCGSRKVYYAYNKNKVNKLCKGCGAFESTINGKRVA